ncbi:MAG: electron transport complex subunit D [Melioribacteraceae bacterium]|nr:MAG: electron transport complex subunit D [Melioribacteraceae bacterium]
MTTITANPSYKLEFASSPHVHSRWSTKRAMWMVVIALVPCMISAVLFYGFYQLLIMAVSVLFAVLTEAAVKYFRKREITIGDGSAVITGLLLALIVPPNFSLVFTALGAVVAIGLGKEIFGGLGFNIFNPALVGRAFLQAAFPVQITTWTVPNYAVEGVTSATPLAAFKFDKVGTEVSNMFFGNIGGSLGETSAIAVLIGGLFLVFAGVINYRVPLAMILGMVIFGGLFWLIDGTTFPDPIFQLTAGGFLFGTFFMATDWVSSPVTPKGMWIFGLGISLVLVMIRLFGGLPEGVMYAILFMNGFVPLINRYTRPTIFGEAK